MRPLYRALLWPFGLMYNVIIRFRNHLYNIGYKHSFGFQTCVISVGNLSVGGNGKTPMVEYLTRLVRDKYPAAILSRGYGRKTSGFKLVDSKDNADTVGDEPFQMHLKFSPQIVVAVGEDRALAIPKILFEKPEIKIILLDDAFQHRAVKPQFSILVTDFAKPFFRDHILPLGRLREPRSGVKRADVVIVTKCPPSLTVVQQQIHVREIQNYAPGIPVHFTGVRYLPPLAMSDQKPLYGQPKVLLFSGIANASPLEEYVADQFSLVAHQRYPDHYRYREQDIAILKNQLDKINGHHKIMLTTEKDMVRLRSQGMAPELPIFYIPIEISWLSGEQDFQMEVLNTIRKCAQ